MKLHILSDLHLEFAPFTPPAVDADVVILAGDIHIKDKGLDQVLSTFPDRPVFYIPGNHEYYGTALPRHLEKLREKAAGTHIRILDNESLRLGDTTFLCCTLWTDFALFGDPRIAGHEASQVISDYRKIRVSPTFRKLRSIDTAGMHHKSITWLQEQVSLHKDGQLVIITHHAPSRRSISEEFRDDILSAAYASNLDAFVAESGAVLWIHGHLHSQSDYTIGNTRVICNPRGYPDEPNDDFIPELVIEI
ncbi:MAG: metallophosphoesterase [Gammaproteobacteria bacterium]|nr:metallophosphoesterase [Gammaproteobacteria bacterium]MDH5653705.1 metallophosphoesterase [Gammaproteobacteria bacterium]